MAQHVPDMLMPVSSQQGIRALDSSSGGESGPLYTLQRRGGKRQLGLGPEVDRLLVHTGNLLVSNDEGRKRRRQKLALVQSVRLVEEPTQTESRVSPLVERLDAGIE